MKLSEKA